MFVFVFVQMLGNFRASVHRHFNFTAGGAALCLCVRSMLIVVFLKGGHGGERQRVQVVSAFVHPEGATVQFFNGC